MPHHLPMPHAGDAAMRHRMGLAMVDAIAALSDVDYRAVGLEGFGKLDNWLERQVGRWASQLASYAEMPGWTGPDAIPGVAKVARWLEDHRPETVRAGIIHGDFHFGNVLFQRDSGELAAVVDWELCTLGDPLLGTLQVGAPANLQVLDVTGPHLSGRSGLVARLAYAASAADVRDVYVAGRRVTP